MSDMWTVITHTKNRDREPMCDAGYLVSVTIRTESGYLVSIPGEDVVILTSQGD